MALEFMTGFDCYTDSAGMLEEWDSLSYYTPSAGRFAPGAAVYGNTFQKFLPSGALATRTVGFAFQIPLTVQIPGPLVSFYDNAGSASQVELSYNFATHQLTVTRNGTALGTCAGLYLPGVWYYLEVQVTISSTAGAVTVNAYPAPTPGGSNAVFAATNLNTQTSANAAFDTLILARSWPVYFDDLYVTNPSGGANVGFLGESRITTILPTGDSAVNHAFTPSTGTAHFSCVSQSDPTTDVPSVSANAVGAIDTYTFPVPGINGTVAGVKVSLCARKDDTGARSIASEFRTNAGVEHSGTEQSLYSNYKFFGTNWDLNPATSAAWVAADFAGAEFGMKVTG